VIKPNYFEHLSPFRW